MISIRNKLDHKPSKAMFNSRGQLKIEDATIVYPNFRGLDFNGNPPRDEDDANGKRNFKVFIDDPALAEELNEKGWSISLYTDKDTGAVYNLLKVKVSYKFYEPEITRHMPNGVAQPISKEICHTIDEDDNYGSIVDGACKMIITPSTKEWNYGGKTGINVYLSKFDYLFEESEDNYNWDKDSK